MDKNYDRSLVIDYMHEDGREIFRTVPPDFGGDLVLEQCRALLNANLLVTELGRIPYGDPRYPVLHRARNNEMSISEQMEALRSVGHPRAQ